MISFVIPNLFSTIALLGEQSSFPVLGRMLSKAKVEKSSYDNPYDLVSDVFSIPNSSKCHFSGVASLLELGETGSKPSVWTCIASPVIVSPNRDQLDLDQYTGFDISHDEAISFCDEFNDYFKEDGINFTYTDSGKWFCHAETEFETPDTSPRYIEGKNIAPHIPQGKSGAMWRRTFNEMQLLLHHSKTNQKRSQSGKAEINSIWFWGGGVDGAVDEETVVLPENEKTTIFTDDCFSYGLALSCKYSTEDFTSAFETLKLNKQNIFIPNLELVNWLEWDEYYFAPALKALKQGKIDSIVFYLDLNKKFTLHKKDLLRFWLAKKDVTDFIDTK